MFFLDVYESQTFLEVANNYQWKLKVIDSIDVSEELPKEERRKLLDNLIENRRVRESSLKNRLDRRLAEIFLSNENKS